MTDGIPDGKRERNEKRDGIGATRVANRRSANSHDSCDIYSR